MTENQETPIEVEPGAEMQRWGDAAQYASAPMRERGVTVKLLQAPADPLGSVAAMCRMYEGKPTYDLREITDEEREHYWEEMMKTHLTAPLESIVFHFFLEGIDRSFTHQMVRQRTACYAQESLRFAVKEQLAQEVRAPVTIREDSPEMEAWESCIESIQECYDFLVNNGVPSEDARGLLPHAVPTRIHYITNLRNLIEHSGNRLCTQAQFAWREVWLKIIPAIRGYDPITDHLYERGGPYAGWQYQLIADSQVFKPICYMTGKCEFKAEFDRGCTIRERVDRGAFEEIRPEEWLADPNAGRTK